MVNLKYLTPKEIAEKWGISQRRVHALCLEGRLEGAKRHGWIWMIPETIEKPKDGRVKTGKYIKLKEESIEQERVPILKGIPMPRPSLIAKISPPGSRLTYIHAAAGYGKTTLLIQYAKEQKKTVWISIDDEDNDMMFFLKNLESSIRAKLINFEFHAQDYIPLLGSKFFISKVLPGLLRGIGSRTFTLILDDVHKITNNNIIYFLTELANVCPSNLTLVVASRHEPWSALFKLMMTGEVTELTKKDLRFTPEETEQIWGFYNDEAYIATEGWILAIQSYHIGNQGNKKFSFTGTRADRDLCYYLLNEIFIKLPDEIQQFLKGTSWIPDIDVAKCNELLGINNSWEIIEELIRQNVFIERISATAFQYHVLFRSFLQQYDDGLGWKILHKGMNYFYDRGDYLAAADYALIMEDEKVIHNCINAIADSPFDKNRYIKLKKYFAFIDAHPIEMSPRFQLAKGIFLSNQGNFPEAEKYLKFAMSKMKIDDKNLYLYATTHKARVLRNLVSIEESNRCIDDLVPFLEGVSMQGWYVVMIEKIYNLTLTSQLTSALKLTLLMMEKCTSVGDLRVRSWFERYLTAIYFHMGDYKNCLRVYEKNLKIPQKDQDWLIRHCVGAYAAKAYQMAGQEEKALPLLDSELRNLHQLGLMEELSINYLIYAEVLSALELKKHYLGKVVNFAESDKYLNLAEEYALLNRSNRDYARIVNVWKLCSALVLMPEKAKEYIDEILTLLEKITPMFQTLAYGRMANALEVLQYDRKQYKEYYEKSIEVGESVSSYGYVTIAYGKLASLYLDEGEEKKGLEYTRKFMELASEYDNRFYFCFKTLFGPILKFAAEAKITPDFTREMLIYGSYTVKWVYINTLGTLYIAPSYDKKNPVKIRTLKARELLAYLLEHREGATRDQIAEDLWWESEANVTSLFHTRRGEIRLAFEKIGAGNPIHYEEGVYRLSMDEIVCDYDEFKVVAARFKKEPILRNAQIVVDKYTGRYLNDLEALWAERTRLQWEEVFLEAADVLMKDYNKSGEKYKTLELLQYYTKLRNKD